MNRPAITIGNGPREKFPKAATDPVVNIEVPKKDEKTENRQWVIHGFL
jgi:hypothetical protein